MNTVRSVIFVVFSFFLSPSLYAFRCGGNLVAIKDSVSRVRQLCGEPTLTDTRQKETVQRLGFGDERRTYVTIDTWVYDLGSANLQQYLQFENKLMAKEWTGDFGGRSQPDKTQCDASQHDLALGKDQLEIRMKCGEPNEKNHLEDRTVSPLTPTSFVPMEKNQLVYPTAITPVVSVDEWIYEFAPNKKMTKLQFENGVLVRVLKDMP